jgi:hypothetical protein
MRQQDQGPHKGPGLWKPSEARPGVLAYRAGACAVTCADKASRKRTVADTVS